MDPSNLRELVKQIAAWLKPHASRYKLHFFKDAKPSTIEERILARSGKIIYIPSTKEGIIEADPYPDKRYVTRETFRLHLEATGVDSKYVDETMERYLRRKAERFVFSEAWIPILFQEYVVGYLQIWNDKEGQTPFGMDVVDVLWQFTKVIAYSLKIHGFFEDGKMKNDPFKCKIIDISASGLLFAQPGDKCSQLLLPNVDLALYIRALQRKINCSARIIRGYQDSTQNYFGCSFQSMEPEDLRYLFEFLYGKSMTDSDASFLLGKV
jgi:hypothetical protein